MNDFRFFVLRLISFVLYTYEMNDFKQQNLSDILQIVEFTKKIFDDVFLIIKKRYCFFQTSLHFFALHYTIFCVVAIYGAISYYINL